MVVTGYVLLGMLLWQIVCFSVAMICDDEEHYKTISSGLIFLIALPVFTFIKWSIIKLQRYKYICCCVIFPDGYTENMFIPKKELEYFDNKKVVPIIEFNWKNFKRRIYKSEVMSYERALKNHKDFLK